MQDQIPKQAQPAFASTDSPLLQKMLRTLFTCWHFNLSWPFTIDGETYRVCLKCGARRQFILETWQSAGGFYHVSGLATRKPQLLTRKSNRLQHNAQKLLFSQIPSANQSPSTR